MYFVELKLKLPDGSIASIGTSSTPDLDKAVSHLEAYRACAESLVCCKIVVSYELKIGNIPNSKL